MHPGDPPATESSPIDSRLRHQSALIEIKGYLLITLGSIPVMGPFSRATAICLGKITT